MNTQFHFYTTVYTGANVNVRQGDEGWTEYWKKNGTRTHTHTHTYMWRRAYNCHLVLTASKEINLSSVSYISKLSTTIQRKRTDIVHCFPSAIDVRALGNQMLPVPARFELFGNGVLRLRKGKRKREGWIKQNRLKETAQSKSFILLQINQSDILIMEDIKSFVVATCTVYNNSMR